MLLWAHQQCVCVPLIVCSFLTEVNGNLRGSLLLPDPLPFTFFSQRDRQTHTNKQCLIVNIHLWSAFILYHQVPFYTFLTPNYPPWGVKLSENELWWSHTWEEMDLVGDIGQQLPNHTDSRALELPGSCKCCVFTNNGWAFTFWRRRDSIFLTSDIQIITLFKKSPIQGKHRGWVCIQKTTEIKGERGRVLLSCTFLFIPHF